ncbi:hemoglobin/transferrin/lactoferrin receptor protein [Colwellia chukchiensis]|uniref:Hemoglobin/transferrin/lactoferrin receptor protein n=1 Tax=Colwellia chukchiensis TaxID=641665 RepID=A0A1H7GW61_9GAMM|nr:TonB-dependent receptor [Colwellia chukchiensis]SEK41292.1 hemoglobin/transferrin/lactoferrin receptor protein [Colwellia chukchiensis]
MTKLIYLKILAISSLVNLPANASSSPNKSLAIETITITAERLAINELHSPYSTTLIYQDQFLQQGTRTTVDAIAMVPGVLLQKTAHGQGSPYIRGFTGFRNVFLIDGVRLNNSVFREGPNQYWNTVDPYSIGKFEVVKGPTSVVYGSDAIGGTVNAITQFQSIDELDNETSLTGFYRAASAEQSQVFRASLAQKLTETSGIALGLSAKDYGDLIAGGSTNEQPNTGYDELNFDFKWLTSIADKYPLTVAYFKTKQNDVPRTHKTLDAISFAGTSLGKELARDTDQDRSLLYIKLATLQHTMFYDTAELSLSYQQQSEVRNRLRTNNRTDQQGFDINTLGLNINLNKHIDEHTIVYGAEYYRDSVASFASNNIIQGPVADDAHYQWLGLYGQSKYYLNQQVSIDFGTRWSYIEVDADSIKSPLTGNRTSLKSHWHNIVFNARANWQIVPKSKSLYLGIAQGFRAPNLSDLTRFDSARSNEFEIPALTLKPEHYLTLDTGIKYRSNTVNYDIALYYTSIKDQIQRVPTGAINTDGEFEISKQNIGKGYVYGTELSFDYRVNRQLQAFMKMAYIKGKVDTFPSSDHILSREYLSRLMPTNATLGLHYTASSELWWLTSTITAYRAGDRLSTRDRADTQRIPPGGTPGFAVWDIGGGFNLSPALQVTLNIDNILDKNYRIHGSGQNEAGLNIIASVRYSF